MENPIEQSTESISTPAAEENTGQEQTPSGGEESQPAGATGSEQQPTYDIESFNKYFGSQFEDEGSLRSVLESPTKLTEYEAQLASREEELTAAQERAAKYDEFIDYFDPTKLFGDEQTWKMVELRKKFPGKDQATVQRVLDQSFTNLPDMDKLILADKLKVPGNIPDDVRQKGVLKKLGIEVDDLSDLSDIDKYTISSAVADNAELFKEIRDFKPEDMKYDIVAEKEKRAKEKEAQKAELSTKWEPLANSLMSNYKEAKFVSKNEKGEQVEIFKFAADENFQKEFAEPFMATLLNSGMEPSKENLQIAANYLDERFKVMNINRIVNEAIKHGKTLSAEETHKEIHNDSPQNTGQAPKTSTGELHTIKEWMKIKAARRQKPN